jgi:hypothetical protein
MKSKKIDSSNIRKYLNKWKKYKLLKETYSGHPKRYKIEEIGMFSIVELPKINVYLRPFRDYSKTKKVWSKKTLENIVKNFFEEYIDKERREEILNYVYDFVDLRLRKLGLSEINITTLIALIDEALYQKDSTLGFRFRLIGGTIDYWDQYTKIIDTPQIHNQPLEKRIGMDINLQRLPSYVLDHFLHGYVYGHGLRDFSKLFSVSVDMRPFFKYGIKIRHYPEEPPKHPDSILAFCRVISILCNQHSAGSIIINNLNNVVSPYLKHFNDEELEQWIQNLIKDIYELYAIRPKDPIYCGLILNYERSPLDEEEVFVHGKKEEMKYRDFNDTAKRFVDIFLKVYDTALKNIIFTPYPRIIIRVSRETLKLMPESSIESIKNILLRFGAENPIYFINTESNMYKLKPNSTLSVEAQTGGYVEPRVQRFSGVATFISIILPLLYEKTKKDNLINSCREIFSSFAQFQLDKINKIKEENEGILSMKNGESSSLFDPQHFSLNIGTFGIYDLVSEFGVPLPEEIYLFLNQLKGEINITKSKFKLDIRLSYPPRKSGIYRTYAYIKTSRSVDKGWSPPNNWVSVLPELGIDERLEWEAKLHEIFDGGYVSRFTLGSNDDFIKFMDSVIDTNISFFKINLRKDAI